MLLVGFDKTIFRIRPKLYEGYQLASEHAGDTF